jgi:hypothetical protein
MTVDGDVLVIGALVGPTVVACAAIAVWRLLKARAERKDAGSPPVEPAEVARPEPPSAEPPSAEPSPEAPRPPPRVLAMGSNEDGQIMYGYASGGRFEDRTDGVILWTHVPLRWSRAESLNVALGVLAAQGEDGVRAAEAWLQERRGTNVRRDPSRGDVETSSGSGAEPGSAGRSPGVSS